MKSLITNLLFMVLYWVKTFQMRALLKRQFKVNPIILLQQLHSTHYTFLVSGDIKYDLQSRFTAKEDRNPQQCIRYTICKVFLLLQPSVEGYIVSLKTQIPDLSQHSGIFPCLFGSRLCLQRHLLKEKMKLHISASPLSCNKPS